MASKKAGRLAGLAALAGLAYMNKDKLFGAKGETKAAETKADTKKTSTYAETAEDEDAETGRLMRANQMRARGVEEGKKIDGSDRFAGPAEIKDTEFGDLDGAMKRAAETKTTPAKVARSEKAPATGGPTPSRDPGGAGKRGGVSVGTGSGGGRGAAAGEEAAYRASRDTGDAMSRRMKAENDGGKSVVDRQDAGAKKAGLSVGDYFTSGKAQIDKQDESGTAAKPTSVTTDETKLSLSDRIKLSRERARSGSGQTDTRSVNERFAGLKKGGAVKKMASGGMTASASKRGDGIAQRGKTRGKMY